MSLRLPRLNRLLPHAALTAAAVLLVLLGSSYRVLDEEFQNFRDRHDHPQPGEYVPPLSGIGLDGAPLSIRFGPGEPARLLMVFNTTCPFCLATIPAWKEIAERVEATPDAEVYGISLDPPEKTRSYAAEHALPFPVLPVEGPRFASYYRTKVVPLTLVIDSSGHVLHARSQGIEGGSAAVDSILAALHSPE